MQKRLHGSIGLEDMARGEGAGGGGGGGAEGGRGGRWERHLSP